MVVTVLLVSFLFAVNGQSSTEEHPECETLENVGKCINSAFFSDTVCNQDTAETTDPFSHLRGSPPKEEFGLASMVQSILGLSPHKDGTSTLDSLFQTARNMTAQSD
jgi:hypothetical protein